MNFFRIKFNKKFFLTTLFAVLVFVVYTINARADDNIPVGNAWMQHHLPELYDTLGVKKIQNYTDEYGLSGLNSENETALNKLAAFLVEKSSDILQWTVSSDLYENVFFSPRARSALISTWKVVRGFVNMFYLLILIFLAISTILQINRFSDKKLFFKVIVSAILVNFSLPITLFVIDTSNMFMVYFASAIGDSGHIVNTLMNNIGADKLATTDGILDFGKNIAEFIIFIVIAVMIFFTAIALLIRLVAYWVLIILSPLAFFSLALPNSSGFNAWRDKLIYYSFFGPIMLFFIWLALTLSTALNQAIGYDPTAKTKDNWTLFFVSYITVMYLLYYGHDKAKSMASKAGTTAGKVMNAGGDWAVKTGKGAGLVSIAPIGLAGYAGYKFGKSKAKAEYRGIKSAAESGEYGSIIQGLTKKGAEKQQSKRDQIAALRYATGKRKEMLEWGRVKTREDEMKKVYNMDDVDTLNKLVEEGGVDGRVAALRLAEKYRLNGDGLKKSMQAVKGNKMMEKFILDHAVRKNKLAFVNYRIQQATEGDKESEKWLKERKVAIEAMIGRTINQEYWDKKMKKKEKVNLIIQSMVHENMNIKDQGNLLNEDLKKSREVAEYIKEYHNRQEDLTEEEYIKLMNTVKSEEARVVLRDVQYKKKEGGEKKDKKQ